MNTKRSYDKMNDSENMFNSFVYDQMKIKELYPNVKFLIALPLKMLNRRLSTSNQILIQTSSCNCDKENMDYILEELNNVKHEVHCEHQYLKAIQKTKRNDVFKLYFW
jgi:hypothetical protein